MRRPSAAFWAALTFAAATILTGTAPAWGQTPTPPPAPDTPLPPPDPTAEFFNDATVHEIQLTINPRDLEQLKLEFQKNTYYPCHFTWRDQTVKNIGIRSRGTGSRSGIKPGLRVDFDQFTAKQRFLELKSIVLRNNTQDPSMLHERVTMKLFEKMGVPTPRETNVRLVINGVFAGLYTAVESIDKVFLSRHFNENDGYLYEYDYDSTDEPYYFTYRGPEPGLYSPKPFKPVTHEKDPNAAPLEAMIKVINETPDEEFRAAIAPFLDLKKFLTHVAVENFLADIDGFLGNYAMNNFYLYRFEQKDLSMLLPWDKSHTFNVGPDHSIWHNIHAPSWLQNRLMERIMDHPDLVDFYVSEVGRAADISSAPVPTTPSGETPKADGPEPGPQKGWLETEVLRQYEQVRDLALSDPVKPFSNAEFEAAVQSMLFFARERPGLVRLQVDKHFGR